MPPVPVHSGDGSSPDEPSAASPMPPGQLVGAEVVPAAEVARGPRLPLFLATVPAGFPSPADDHVEARLDLHELTGAASPSYYFLRLAGESMAGAGIHDGDMLVVDRALRPVHGAVVVASVDGELTVKRFGVRTVGGRLRAVRMAANLAYPALEVGEVQELLIWGVVTHRAGDVQRSPSPTVVPTYHTNARLGVPVGRTADGAVVLEMTPFVVALSRAEMWKDDGKPWDLESAYVLPLPQGLRPAHWRKTVLQPTCAFMPSKTGPGGTAKGEFVVALFSLN